MSVPVLVSRCFEVARVYTARVLDTYTQSQKNPVSASAMLTGKFLQIWKVFATSSFLTEEFPETKYPYDMQSAWMNWKVYG